MNEHQQFGENLKQAMMNQGYPPKASVLERIFNLAYYGKPISLHGVAKWLRGESIPPFDKLEVLAQVLEISVQDLVSSHRIKPSSRQKQAMHIEKHFWDSSASYQERQIFQAFLDLPPQQRAVVREVILALHKVYRGNQ